MLALPGASQAQKRELPSCRQGEAAGTAAATQDRGQWRSHGAHWRRHDLTSVRIVARSNTGPRGKGKPANEATGRGGRMACDAPGTGTELAVPTCDIDVSPTSSFCPRGRSFCGCFVPRGISRPTRLRGLPLDASAAPLADSGAATLGVTPFYCFHCWSCLCHYGRCAAALRTLRCPQHG